MGLTSSAGMGCVAATRECAEKGFSHEADRTADVYCDCAELSFGGVANFRVTDLVLSRCVVVL